MENNCDIQTAAVQSAISTRKEIGDIFRLVQLHTVLIEGKYGAIALRYFCVNIKEIDII